jgi:urease subunit alpha
VLPSSTNPTNPFTKHTLAEHLEMIMTVHWLNPAIPEDVAIAESRIRAETVAAEDILHDLGAISMMSSDSMGMGRVGETILRTWQLAHKMKAQRGAEGAHDNARVLRYLAKYTINPAIATGIAAHVGSLEPGKLADIVLWRPKFFGVKPELVIKGGVPVMGATGSADASIRYAEPVYLRPLWGAVGAAPSRLSLLFTSQLASEQNLARRVPTTRRVVPVRGTRMLRKQHMVRNAALPAVRVNPETYEVTVDGQRAWCDPVDEVPLNQLYFL